MNRILGDRTHERVLRKEKPEERLND